ncbi:DUF3592 domain-containing protein [Paraburkholderia madseniana]|uniref:DUF3592 domain-containing protein n=1 Tax=Paraburkholderia madseniana TaxID=2599607 RepID=UPI003BEF2385
MDRRDDRDRIRSRSYGPPRPQGDWLDLLIFSKWAEYEAKSTALNNAYFVHMFSSRQRAEVDEYTRPVGSPVSVYYDPTEPQKSVLDFPLDSSQVWPLESLTLSLSAPSIGTALLASCFRRLAPKSNAPRTERLR